MARAQTSNPDQIAHRRSVVIGTPTELDPLCLCPMRDVLDRVGDQWSLLVLFYLTERTHRFGELKTAIGDISPRVLTHTLRHLEQDGLVTRKIYPTIPPKVEYTLTRLGRSLTTVMRGVVRWAERNHRRIRLARQAYAARPA